ncbi:MAG: hypothetical protein OEY56_01425 [Cyclobacteriaceae bacterium]|nr:hypothetical protein [Cyclobacteriaceae bacterium]
MKKIDAILFFLAIGFFVIGTHQAIRYDISGSYWIFMLSLSLLFLYGYRKNRQQPTDKNNPKKK